MTADEVTSPHQGAAVRLGAFLGEWSVSGSFEDDTGEHVITGRWTYTEVADGWGVRGDLTTTIAGVGTLEESELIGVDAVDGSVHLFSMNRLTIRDHVGRWEGPHTLVTSWADGNGDEVLTITFDDTGSMRAEVVERSEGAVVATTRLALTRAI